MKEHRARSDRPGDYDEFKWGRSTWPFLMAVRRGDAALVLRMLADDLSLARAEYAYLQPLHYAVQAESACMVRVLLDAGADPLAGGWSGRFGDEIRDDTPLGRARDRGVEEIVALLEDASAQPRSGPPERSMPTPTPERELEDQMMKACHHGDVDLAREMIVRHAGIAQAGLYEAVHQNHPELVELLLASGADATKPWRWACWYTPLMHSLRYATPRYGIAQTLLDHGVKPDEMNGMGMTTLHILAAEGTTAAVQWLLDRGAALEPRDRQFESRPLAWAARAGREDMMRLLLTRGARSIKPDDPAWATPLAWLRKRGHRQLESLLSAEIGRGEE